MPMPQAAGSHDITACHFRTDRVLLHVNLEQNHRNLVNSRLAYVGISRARHDVRIYTSNLTQLGQRLGQDVSKSAAFTQHNIKPEMPAPSCPVLLLV